MKRLFLRIAVSLAALLFAITFTPVFAVSSETVGESLLPDGSFDDKTFFEQNWNLTNAKYKFNKSTGKGFVYNLSESMVVVKPYINETEVYFDFEQGDYVVTFDVYIDGSATVSADLTTTDGTTVVCGSETISGVTEFTPYTFEFTLETAGSYRFGLYASDIDVIAILRFDNIGLYAVAAAVEEPVNPLLTEYGAYIRADGKQSGIRFLGRIDKKVYDDYVKDYENVEVGMIIVPTDYLIDCDFTYQALSADGKNMKICVAERWNNEDSLETDGYYGFNCALGSLLPYNLDRKFSARSFLRYSVDNGSGGKETRYIYSDYSEEANARSALYLAQCFYADTENYELFADYQKAAIRYFLNLIEYPTSSVTENGDGSFTLSFTNVKGYFVLDYDVDKYSITVNSFSVTPSEGTPSFAAGIYFAENSSDIEINITVHSSETFDGCPVRGKVYKTE